MGKLTKENEQLKKTVRDLEKKIKEKQKKIEHVEKKNDELQKEVIQNFQQFYGMFTINYRYNPLTI